ncbi:hypothetical protein LCGC14_0288420 [marine sediment metagenome]|uniref:Uncharacterized protein n=1 Tax=marine sediment metagenome TaxID=412755 RepID=A0A0F9TTM3_9ZZZZ
MPNATNEQLRAALVLTTSALKDVMGASDNGEPYSNEELQSPNAGFSQAVYAGELRLGLVPNQEPDSMECPRC